MLEEQYFCFVNLYGYCTQATGVKGKIEMHATF